MFDQQDFSAFVAENRSVRKFKQNPKVDLDDLEELIRLARNTPSAANKQPLKYVLVEDKEKLKEVFSTLEWAGYLPDWSGPAIEERPTAYVVILSDPKINPKPSIDVGIVAQTILLGARSKGFAGCLLGSITRDQLSDFLQLPQGLVIELVVALGAPGEQIELKTVDSDDIRYWRDDQEIHYVPKRPLTDLILTKF